ncbi:MAG: helix-turn-helix domain-containing protein [Streptosporangiaceae bacterium]
MAADSPTMRRRRLARELTRLREGRGMTIRQAAGALEWDPSKLSRVEGLQRGIIVRDVRRLLDLYGLADEAQREALFELARQAKQRGWWQAYADVMPGEYATLIGMEAEAAEIRTWQPDLVHGLLQTEDYARAVIRAGRPGDTAAEISRRVEIRMTRQQILDRPDPPRIWVVLNEGAVRRVVGGREVMREQLRQLATARDRATVMVQVLPFTAGEHPAMASGPFDLLEFGQAADRGAVTLETMTGSLSLESDADLRQYAEAVGFLQAAALGPRETRDMLITLADEL